MNVLIVEDEKPAREHLIQLLGDIEPSIHIQSEIDTVLQTVKWLQENETDLIFLDINLADDLCFKIFEQVQVLTPIIFITAYNEYVLRAFEVNSVDYLLKPLDKSKLAQAIKKYQAIHGKTPIIDYTQLAAVIQKEKKYPSRFLVTRGKVVASVKVSQIAYFEAQNKETLLITRDNKKYFIEEKLKKLEEHLLDSQYFFRINRSFIIHIDAIEEIHQGSKSRYIVSLEPPTKRITGVSYEKMPAFRAWLKQ